MVDYMGAIKLPFGNMKGLAIGSVIGAIPFVNMFVSGYGLLAAKKAIDGKAGLPSWKSNIANIIVKTIMAIIIGMIYILPGLVLVLVGVAAAVGPIIAAVMSGSSESLGAAIGTAIVAGGAFFLLGMLLWIIGGLLATMGMMNWVKKGNFMSAFALGTALKKVITGTFWVSVIVMIAYAIAAMFIAGIIAAILAFIPVLGWVLSLLVQGLVVYILSVTTYTIYARVYAETP
ncbi:MAG: DUF4013 domain-containing protein [Candidatus Diapherotrites archaeon]